MIFNYILDENNVPVPEPDFCKFAEWKESQPFARLVVAKTELASKDAEVSTVFLGIMDFHGNLFETMVFTAEDSDTVARYKTWDEAAAGHNLIVKELRSLELNGLQK